MNRTRLKLIASYLGKSGGMQMSNYLLIKGLKDKGIKVDLTYIGKNDLNYSVNKQWKVKPNSLYAFIIYFIYCCLSFIKNEYLIALDSTIVRSLGLIPILAKNIILINSGCLAVRYKYTAQGLLSKYLASRAIKKVKLHLISKDTYYLLKKEGYKMNNRYILGRPCILSDNKEVKEKSSEGALKYISICRMIKNKNISNLIQSFDKLIQSGLNIELDLYGSGEEEQELKSQIIAKDNIRLKGEFKHSDLMNIMRSYDYFILPSLHETFGRVWIEACSAGLPMISTDYGNLKNIIKDGYNGIVTGKEITEISNSIVKSYEINNINYKEMSANSIKTAEEYSEKKIVGDLLRIMKQNGIEINNSLTR